MSPVRHARVALVRRRSVQRLTAAGAVVGLASALATIEALAAEPSSDEDVRTVRIAAEEVDLLADPVEAELSPAIREVLEARQEEAEAQQAEPEPEPEPEPAPEPEPEPAPEPEPEPAPQHDGAVDLATWERVAECESGGNWSINTGNGFYGGLQFELRSWEWVGGTGYPHEASKEEQIARAEILFERQGWNAWPSCSRQLGLR